MSTEFETREHRRSKSAIITRRFVLFARSTSAPIEFGSRECSEHYWSRLSLMVCINSNEDASCSSFPWRFLNAVFVSDQVAADPAITTINATGHQLVTLCRSICGEDRAQILDPIVRSEYCFVSSTYILFFILVMYFVVQIFSFSPSSFILLFTEYLPLHPHFVIKNIGRHFEPFGQVEQGLQLLFLEH